MKYVVNWIPLRIRVRSKNTQPHLNAFYRQESSVSKLSLRYIVSFDIWGAQQLRTGCLSILMFLAPLAEVTP